MNPPILAPKQSARRSVQLAYFMALLVLVLGLCGCQTHKIDWTARVGNYTYDEAVKEMGPPDKSATLSDGSMVCEWLTYRGGDGGTILSSGPYGLYATTTPGAPDAFIRLTFSPEKKLTEAKRVYK